MYIAVLKGLPPWAHLFCLFVRVPRVPLLLHTCLQIQNQQLNIIHYSGSEFFSIPVTGSRKKLSIFSQKIVSKLSRKYDPGCSSRIQIKGPDLDFSPIPDPGSATLQYSTLNMEETYIVLSCCPLVCFLLTAVIVACVHYTHLGLVRTGLVGLFTYAKPANPSFLCTVEGIMTL